MKLLIGLVLAIGCLAQGVTPTFKAVTGATTAIGATTIPPAYLIGQGFHEIGLISFDVTAGSCSSAGGWTGLVRLEGSFDNANWSSIASISAAPLNSFTYVATGQGQYSFLRVNYVTLASGANTCKLDLWYAGNLYGQPFVSPRPTWVHNGVTSASSINFTCNQSNITIYGLIATNTTATATLTFNVLIGATIGTAVQIDQLQTPILAIQTTYTLPISTQPWFRSDTSSNTPNNTFFQIVSTSAASDDIRIAFRCE